MHLLMMIWQVKGFIFIIYGSYSFNKAKNKVVKNEWSICKIFFWFIKNISSFCKFF